MSYVYESRPGSPPVVHLGSSYAQPSASEHATPEGQANRHLGWSGDRNAGQPLYEAGSTHANKNEMTSRLKQIVGEFVNSPGLEPLNREVKSVASDAYKAQYAMQVINMQFNE